MEEIEKLEEITKKLGFDPLDEEAAMAVLSKLKDDSPGPFSKLTYEEYDFLWPILLKKYFPERF